MPGFANRPYNVFSGGNNGITIVDRLIRCLFLFRTTAANVCLYLSIRQTSSIFRLLIVTLAGHNRNRSTKSTINVNSKISLQFPII